ncbi:MAG: hypothetical protein RL518_33 [Pseudomonadota bacterium]|jgi:hypothetical protein
MLHQFIPGTVWILSDNASCIPAGCYRLQDVHDEFLIFTVGPDISFGLPRDYYSPLLRKAGSARTMRTSPRSFLRRYAKLIQAPPRAPTPPSGMTFCAISPHLQRKLMELCPEGTLSAAGAMH